MQGLCTVLSIQWLGCEIVSVAIFSDVRFPGFRLIPDRIAQSGREAGRGGKINVRHGYRDSWAVHFTHVFYPSQGLLFSKRGSVNFLPRKNWEEILKKLGRNPNGPNKPAEPGAADSVSARHASSLITILESS